MNAEAPQPPKQNGSATSALLQMASGGDNWVKLATIGLIVLSGGSNWLATQRSGDDNREEVRRVVSEINELYSELHTTIDRQKEILDTVKRLEQKLGK